MNIWKYELRPIERQKVSLPAGAQVLSVAKLNQTLCIWALVDSSTRFVDREFEIFGTGWGMDDQPRRFIGTVMLDQMEWHVFEREVHE